MSKNIKVVRNAAQPTADIAKLETVTPEIAEKWLGKRAPNRTLSMPIVNRYARDIEAGQWIVTGDPIRFNEEEQLIDGQHRLAAIVQAGKAIQTYVVHGLDHKAMDVIDSGKKRTPGDMLHIHGYPNAMRLAASARWMLTIKLGLTYTKSRKASSTNSEILETIRKHPNLTESSKFADGVYGMPGSLLAAVHYIGANLLEMPDEADAFAGTFRRRLPNPEFYDNAEVDPALKWCERLLGRRKGQFSLTEAAVLNGTITVWNMYAKHQPLLRGIVIPRNPQAIEGLDVDKI
jgi:hypothetical protein